MNLLQRTEPQQSVDAGDAAPSVDAVMGFDKQSAALQSALDRWQKFKSESLPLFNKLLEQNGLTILKL